MPYQAISALTLLLLIVGGINWALVGLFDFDLVTTVLGTLPNSPEPSTPARIISALIGLSAVWLGILLVRRLLVPLDKMD
jgi:uncharacterized membrane protein YuzA (DUF378 family)